jgi:hypothetical protein
LDRVSGIEQQYRSSFRTDGLDHGGNSCQSDIGGSVSEVVEGVDVSVQIGRLEQGDLLGV